MKKISAFIIALIMIVSLAACGGEKQEWPDSGLGAMLPAPGSGTLKNLSNRDDRFSVSVDDISDGEFQSYVSACKEKGFSLDTDMDGIDYYAFNEEGYKLFIMKFSSSMSIYLDPPIKLGELRWPGGTAGKAVPKPDSSKGSIKRESEDGFLVYVGDTTKEQFNDYIEKCIYAGFDVKYDRRNRSYHAYDKFRHYIEVKYYGFNIMTVKADLDPDDEETDPLTEEEEQLPTDAPEESSAKDPTQEPTQAAEKPTEKNAPAELPISVPDGFTALQAYFCNCTEDKTLDELEKLASDCGLYAYRYAYSSTYLEMKVSAEPYSEEADDSEKYIFPGDYVHIVYDNFGKTPKMKRTDYCFNIKGSSRLSVEFVPYGMIYSDGEVKDDRYYVIKEGATYSDRYYDAQTVTAKAVDMAKSR